jgi:hypothetical protein
VGADSSAGGYGRWRGCGRATSALAAALVLMAALLAGCGGSGHGAETDPEKGSDAKILGEALARELTLLAAYTQGRPLAHRRWARSLQRQLRAQEQEYVDALTKAIRGLGGDTEAEAEDAGLGGVKSQAALFVLASQLESEAVEFYVDKADQLYTSAPRTLDAWLAAGHGQHLALLPHGGG